MKNILLIILTFCSLNGYSQFTRQDTLRGSVTPERAWWDVLHYNLDVEVFPTTKSIKGTNTITYKVLQNNQVMQIDLQRPMVISQITQNGKRLSFISKGNAHFITLKENQKINTQQSITIYFEGLPVEATNPPWDGGFTWQKDENNNFFIANANQGIGASVWWPNKDHPYDEPDNGIDLKITTPNNLVSVGNGRLISKTENNGSTTTSYWKVVNPINNYGININIGNYVNFSETYYGLKGKLDVDYWVLEYNLTKAKEQFKQVPMMLEAFEHWFGPYPFYEDSFKLVEVPYLGMEHQSSVTYGNRYKNGYLGRDLSGSGWGLKFDFIIIHEAGHEWFANNITNNDVADMWIHEGFTAYSENLYLDYHFGTQAANEYVIGTRRMIQNDRPLIGNYNVNNEGSSDMYYKGANILHTLRQLIEDDEKWRAILTGLNKQFYHQTVSSQQVEAYISKQSNIDLTQFWDQYLRTTKIPLLEYKIEENTLKYKYTNIIEGFDMPIKIKINEIEQWIYPKKYWQILSFKETPSSLTINPNFFVESKKSN